MPDRPTSKEQQGQVAACRALAPLLAAAPDGDLAPPDRTRLESHLEVCLACRTTLRQLQEAGTMLRGEPLPRVVLPSGEQMAHRILEREAARAWRWPAWPPLAWLSCAAVLVATLLLAVPRDHSPAGNPEGAAGPAPVPTREQEAQPTLLVVDDEETGRQVLLGGPGPAAMHAAE